MKGSGSIRERLDFSSISQIIFNNQKADRFTYEDYCETLFQYAYSQTDIKIVSLDQGNWGKTIRGERNVNKDITFIYSIPENLIKLEEGVVEVLKGVEDPDYINEQINYLLWHDPTISPMKKKQMSEGNDLPHQFIAKCLLHGMGRKALNKDGKSADIKTLLLSDYLLDYHLPTPNKVFCGRKKELQKIHNNLAEDSSLFLHGIGGIGKTELVKQYAKCFKKEYQQQIIYLYFNESLYRTILELDFVDDRQGMSEQELFEEHYRFFKSLGSNTLVILDNFNIMPEMDELFHEFLSLAFRLLVTTRNVIEDVPCYPVEEISSIKALEEIFYAYAPRGKEKPNIVREIIEEVYRHTLMVELACFLSSFFPRFHRKNSLFLQRENPCD